MGGLRVLEMEVENKVRINVVLDSVVWVSVCRVNGELCCCIKIWFFDINWSKD